MPSSQHLTIEVVDRVGDDLAVSVRGELDMSTAPELSAALLKLSEQASRTITLDMSGVSFLDSSAIGALIASGQELSTAGRSLRIGHRSAIVSRVLEITGLTEDSDAFHVLPDEG